MIKIDSSSSNKYSNQMNNQTKGKKKVTSTKKFQASKYAAKLSRAKSKSQLASVVALAKSDLKRLASSGASKEQIRKAKSVVSLIEQKALGKASRIQKEKQLEQEKKMELSAEQIERAEETNELLKKQKRSGKAKDAIDRLHLDNPVQRKEEINIEVTSFGTEETNNTIDTII